MPKLFAVVLHPENLEFICGTPLPYYHRKWTYPTKTRQSEKPSSPDLQPVESKNIMISLDQLQHRRLTDLSIDFLLAEPPGFWASGLRLLAKSPFFGASDELWEVDSTPPESLESEPPTSSRRRVEEPAPNSTSTTESRMESIAPRGSQTNGDLLFR